MTTTAHPDLKPKRDPRRELQIEKALPAYVAVVFDRDKRSIEPAADFRRPEGPVEYTLAAEFGNNCPLNGARRSASFGCFFALFKS